MVSTSYGPQASIDDDVALRREALVLQYLPQVRLIAKRIHDRLPSYVAVDDLISAGVVGLIGAIDQFRSHAQRPAQYLCRAADSRRNHGQPTGNGLGAAGNQEEIQADRRRDPPRQQRLGREPSEEEIAAELEIPPAEYQKWLSDVQSAELERLECAPGDNSRGDLLNFISDDEEDRPSRIVERSALERILALAIDRMPKTERTVLTLYYYEELNLREIADVMGVHLSRVHQLRVQAVLRLRSHLERVWLTQPRSRS